MKRILVALLFLCLPCYAVTNYFENCDDISDWTDADNVGVSTQETFDSKSTFKFTVATGGSGRYAYRYISTPITLPTKYFVEMSVYHDSLAGALPGSNSFDFGSYRTTTNTSSIYFASSGLFIYNGSSYVEVGTDLVDVDVPTTWLFYMDTSDITADNKCKLWAWKNGALVASAVTFGDVSTGFTAGRILLIQRANTTAGNGNTTYVDYLRIYSEDGKLIQTIIE